MKVTTINVQITKQPRQYEAVRLGIECSLDAGENEQDAIKALNDELLAIYADMYAKPQAQQTQQSQQAQDPTTAKEPQPAPAESPKPDNREVLRFGDKRIQAIVARIEKNPAKAEDIIKQTLQYFAPDEDTMRVLRLAAQLNQ